MVFFTTEEMHLAKAVRGLPVLMEILEDTVLERKLGAKDKLLSGLFAVMDCTDMRQRRCLLLELISAMLNLSQTVSRNSVRPVKSPICA